jgi:Flp pilus assembly protein TadB
VVGLIIEQSYNAIVLEDRRLLESLGRGWEVFRKNWLSVVVVGLIQWVVRLVVGIVEFIVSLVILLPLIVVVVATVANNPSFSPDAIGRGMLFALVLTACCTMAILIPLSILANGVLLTYLQTMWTLAYRRMTELMKPALPPQVEIIEPQ